MTAPQHANDVAPPLIAPRVAWRRAAVLILATWIIVGGLGFGLAAQVIAQAFPSDLDFGALALDLVFAVCILLIVLGIARVQNANGETLRDIGWRRPTTRRAVLAGLLLGLAWTGLTYARGGSILAVSWERPLMIVIGLWLAFGEELAMRGYLMEQLNRGGVAPWLQVVVSALATGCCYHGVIGLHYSVLYAVTSSVLFGLIAVLCIWGRRSLTPGWIAHSLSHVLGDPTLTMGILLGVLAATPA